MNAQELQDKSNELYAESRRLRDLSSELSKQASEFASQAVEAIVPFKRGDKIEYQERSGRGKMRTIRAQIQSLRISYNGNIEINSHQMNAKGEVGRIDKTHFFQPEEVMSIKILD